MLRVEGIETFYGCSQVLHGVSLEVGEGEIVALLGRNGVGKSTTMKSVIGLVPPQRGSVTFKGVEVSRHKPHRISRLGIGYVPEERRIFPELTVRENLQIGAKPGPSGDAGWTIDKIYGYFPRLGMRDRQKGKHLSGGEQQMLTIGRTLMGNPELLLVDEPTEGLAPALVDLVVEICREIHAKGCSLLVVEHAFDVALGLASRGYVMSKGEIVFQGTRDEIHANEGVRKKYLEV